MGGFGEQLMRMGATRLVVMFGVAAGMAFALLFVAMRIGENDRALLYAGLDLAEAAEIAQELDQAGIGHEIGAGGTAVYVDAREVANARMMMAAEGLPSSGSVGYEIFDNQDALGSSRFVQNVNLVRALEGELGRTIRALDGVASARVHLALPERRLFERDAVDATASVWIELRHDDLAARHARAIRTLVAGAVPGLSPSNVTILDSNGRVLAAGGGDDPAMASADALDERRAGVEESIRRRIIDLVEGIVGPGAVRAQVAADVDFNRVTEEAVIFDPEGRVARAVTRESESANEADREGENAVSVSENVPETDGADAGADRRSESSSTLTRETTNYEISRRTRLEEHEVGVVRRLSVAVAVDGARAVDDEGAPLYTARTDQEMAEIEALVRSAIGFDEARGDVVTVRNMAFARAPVPDFPAAAGGFSLATIDVMRVAELGVLLLVAVMIIFLVVRPLVRGAVAGPAALPAGAALAGASPAALAAAGGPAAALEAGAAGERAGLPAPSGQDSEDSIDIAKIEGQVKASSVKKISEIVSTHPDESASIIRTWLHSE